MKSGRCPKKSDRYADHIIDYEVIATRPTGPTVKTAVSDSALKIMGNIAHHNDKVARRAPSTIDMQPAPSPVRDAMRNAYGRRRRRTRLASAGNHKRSDDHDES